MGGIPPGRDRYESAFFQESAFGGGMQQSDFGAPPANHTAGHYGRLSDLNLDPLSSEDTAKLYNRPGDFDSRKEYYYSWGLNSRYGDYKGTGEQNDNLREEMHRNRSNSGPDACQLNFGVDSLSPRSHNGMGDYYRSKHPYVSCLAECKMAVVSRRTSSQLRPILFDNTTQAQYHCFTEVILL
jgi:hypothetical protein